MSIELNDSYSMNSLYIIKMINSNFINYYYFQD